MTKKPIWRDDTHSTEEPTVNSVVIHAVDELRVENHLRMVVNHVCGFHGKGFMPTVYALRDPVRTSDVYYGENDVAYILAVSRGRTMFKKECDKFARQMEQIRSAGPEDTVS